MKWTFKTVLQMAAIVAMAGVVFILALLQYQWTGEISRTEQERLQATLAASVRNFSQEFSYDFQRMCEALEIDPENAPSDFESLLLRHYAGWRNTAAHPNLIASVYIWRTDGAKGPYLEYLDTQAGRFEQVTWPENLESLRGFLSLQAQKFTFVMPDREAVYYPWAFHEQTPALVRPLFGITDLGPTRASARVEDNSSGSEIRPVGFLVVQLDANVLAREYFPALVMHNFGTSDFLVGVRTAAAPYQAIYMSSPDFPVATTTPDATVNLFDAVALESRQRGHPGMVAGSDSQQWQLVVQHSAGSLQVAMAQWRRRYLGISFGLLAVLSGSTILLFSAMRRAERLAKLQMEFVAGVSHELCTPLAVINSAAENLVDGVVDDPAQVRDYGGMIRDQGRRLERLVDEVLLFAAGRFGRLGYDLRPVEVGSIIAQSIDLSESMLQEGGFSVEKDVSDDLPLVVADPVAVSKCMENLISNAMKYAGPGSKWIGIRAQSVPMGRQAEVQISVQDKGIGIPAADLPHIFEPFYRVQAVRDGQIRGVGLGLYLVKRMMESMGGRVTVESEFGRGTYFTLHFPVVEYADRRQGEAA